MQLAVLMAVRNNDSTLKSAINSILNQTFKDFEFIIVDDASTDDSLKVIKTFKDKRIKLIQNLHQLGLTKSLNKGLRQIKTKYIARMDADDISLPQRLKKQLDYLETHPKISLLGTAAYLIDSQGKPLGLKRFPSDHLHLRRCVLSFCPFIHPTWMIRRGAILEIGSYNENFPFAQDYELALRLLPKLEAANLAEPLIKYRVNTDSAISLKNLKKQESNAIQARLLALKNYGYPMTESWRILKPLLSFLIPIGIKKIVYRKFFWTTIVIFSLISLSGCAPSSAPIPITAPSPSPVLYLGWPEYNNLEYHYKLKYPYDWIILPPESSPPEIITFTNIKLEEYPDKPHLTFQVTVTDFTGEDLLNFPEIQTLTSQGQVARHLKIDNSKALFIDNLGPNGSQFNTYVQGKGIVIRFSWDETQEYIARPFKDTILQIIASFQFTQ